MKLARCRPRIPTFPRLVGVRANPRFIPAAAVASYISCATHGPGDPTLTLKTARHQSRRFVCFGSLAEIPTRAARRPLYPWKRTSRSRHLTSAKGHQRTSAFQPMRGAFGDHCSLGLKESAANGS